MLSNSYAVNKVLVAIFYLVAITVAAPPPIPYASSSGSLHNLNLNGI